MRLLLIVFAVGQLLLGLLLWLTPGFFYDEIGPYPPRNDHYMADLATFYLALGAVALASVSRERWRVPVLTLALIQYGAALAEPPDRHRRLAPGLARAGELRLAAPHHGAARLDAHARARAGAVRVFVAGASGAIGRPLVPKLVAAGHEVTGTTRSEERAEAIRAAGATAAVVDVFDAATSPRRGGGGAAGGTGARAHLTSRPARLPQAGRLRADQPRAHGGHAEPARGGADRRAHAASCARASPSPTGPRGRA